MIESQENTINVPKWVEVKLFENLLKQNIENFKSIKEFKPYAGLPPGENYSTIMTRIEILMELEDGSTETQFFMLKTEHELEVYKELVDGMDCLAKEPKVYEELIPAFEKLYRDVGKKVKFGAKYFKLDVAKGHLLLKDLCRCGFKNANRLEGLDIKHAKIVLKKLAQWHAASAVHRENIGSYGKVYEVAQYHDVGRKSMTVFYEGMTKYLLKCLHLYDNSEQYKEKIVSTLKEIHILLHKYNIWGFCTAVGVMAVALLDSSEQSTFDNFLGDSEEGDTFKILMFSNKRYQQHMSVILPWLLNRGSLGF